MTFCTRPLKYSRSRILDLEFEQWLVKYWLWYIIWTDTPAAGNLFFFFFFSVPILRCANGERYSCVCCMSSVRIGSQSFSFFSLCLFGMCKWWALLVCPLHVRRLNPTQMHPCIKDLKFSLSLSLEHLMQRDIREIPLCQQEVFFSFTK